MVTDIDRSQFKMFMEKLGPEKKSRKLRNPDNSGKSKAV